jgi:hypothetical protein
MDGKTVRAITAFALAPLVPSLLFVALNPLFDLSPSKAAFRLALEIAYAVTLVVGVPAYILIQQHTTLSRRTVLRVSGCVGFATVMAPTLLIVLAILVGVPLGLSAGVTFWLIWHRRPAASPPP